MENGELAKTLSSLTPRKKYIILSVVAGIGWLFASLAISILFYYLMNNPQVVFLPPSEETLKKLESNGITRDEVAQLNQFLNASFAKEKDLIKNIYYCDRLFETGNMTHNMFVACSTLVKSNAYHQEQTVDENEGPLSIIKGQAQTNTLGTVSEKTGNVTLNTSGNMTGNMTGLVGNMTGNMTGNMMGNMTGPLDLVNNMTPSAN
jgi:hypothetical protein